MSTIVAISAEVYGGNKRAGAKAWGKAVTSINPAKGDGSGFEGAWLADVDRYSKRDTRSLQGSLPEGSLVILGGNGGSHKNATAAYVLCRAKIGATFEHSAGYQEFSGVGLELLATSGDEIDAQAVLDAHPELAPVAPKWRAIYAAAAETLAAERAAEPLAVLKATQWRRLGSLPGCAALAAADVGEAELEDGTRVYVTWGRNLSRDEQRHYLAETIFQPIVLGADDGAAELILPAEMAAALLPLLLN